MSEESISLFDLLNLSIGTPNPGAVDFGALHVLLHAVLQHLNMGHRETKKVTRWWEAGPGDGIPGISAAIQKEKEEAALLNEEKTAERDTDLQKQIESTAAMVTVAADDQKALTNRIQSCEDGMAEAMKLIKDLQEQKTELQELHSSTAQHKDVAELQETVRTLSDSLQRFPDPEELSQCVTWDVMQSSLLTERESIHKELESIVDSATRRAAPPPTDTPSTHPTPSTPHTPSDLSNPEPGPNQDPSSPPEQTSDPSATPSTPSTSSKPEPGTSQHPSTPSQHPSTPPQHPAVRRTASGMALRRRSSSERYPETVEALKNIGKLTEKFDSLEARVLALEEGSLSNQGSQEVSGEVMEQLSQHSERLETLMSDRVKLESLEEMFLGLANQSAGSDSEAGSSGGSMEADGKAAKELKQQISYLRRSVQTLEEDVKQVKKKMAVTEERARDQHLQDQLDDLRSTLEAMMVSLTSQLSLHDDEEGGGGLGGGGVGGGQQQGPEHPPSSTTLPPGQARDRAAFTSITVSTGKKLSKLFKHYEKLQDTVNTLLAQQTGGSAEDKKGPESTELVNKVQRSILQLQVECERLHESARCLHEENRQRQSHIEELIKTTEELSVKKADKNMVDMVENEIKADKWALEDKVSRLQFDSVTEQLNSLFHELLTKVTGQEQDWSKLMDKVSTEMDCKLNRIELESVKKQLEDRWKTIHGKLQAQGAPEIQDAAGLRKQLVDRFHCLSCDRPVKKYSHPQPMARQTPPAPGFPAHKSIRPFTVYALEHFRQHYRSLKPGTNRYHFEVANASRRMEQLQKSHETMCRKIESAQRKLRPDRGEQAASPRHRRQQQAGPERLSELADYSQLTVSRSCGGSHTVTSTNHRRSGNQHIKQYIQHHIQPEPEPIIPATEEVDIMGLDGQIYKGRLNTPDLNRRETKLPTIPSKDGVPKPKDRTKGSLSVKPGVSPEPPSAKSSRSASTTSVKDYPVSTIGSDSNQGDEP